MQFLITAGTGESVKVEAENWLGAMARAMVFFDAGIEKMVRWVVQPMGEDSVSIDDRAAGLSWVVEPAPVRQIKVVAVAPRLAEPEEPEEVQEARPAAREFFRPDAPPPPALDMSVGSSLRPPKPPVAEEPEPEPEAEPFFSGESLAERLFDLSMDMASAAPNTACRMALDIILEFVPCEAGSVVRGSLNDTALTFVAASGPVANELIGKKLAFGQGISGMAFDTGMTIIVNDVREDSRHFNRFDFETGFETRAVLTVPIQDEAATFGVIQLLNPERTFEPADVEAVEMIAQSLGGALAANH